MEYGYRFWTAHRGRFVTPPNPFPGVVELPKVDVTADHHLSGGVIGRVGAEPSISPSEQGAFWSASYAWAVNCSNGCDNAPGPCGKCGIYFIRDLSNFMEFQSVYHCAGKYQRMERIKVAGRITVQGAVRSVAWEHGNGRRIPEHRASCAYIETLCVESGNEDWIEGLQRRYNVPVLAGFTRENLTHGMRE
jgi:hypothetical protein